MSLSNIKSTKWLIGALVLMNLVLLSILFSFKSRGHNHNDKGNFLKKELNLSDEQAVQFKNSYEVYIKNAREHSKEIRNLKKEMIGAISSEIPDTLKAQNIATEIGRKEVAKEKLLINHYLRLQTECTPEQRPKLKHAFQKILSRKKRRGGKEKEKK